MPDIDHSDRYRGAAGSRYWEYQAPLGKQGGVLNAWKFAPFVADGFSVVDFGCGGGFLLEHLRFKSGIGIEINPEARLAGKARGLDIRESMGEVADEWADVVISNHALEHVQHPLEQLREFRRILRPGGRVVVWLPIDDWRTQRRADPADINGHLYTWTPQLAWNIVREAGLIPLESRVVSHAWPPGAAHLSRMSPAIYNLACRTWSLLRRRRQLFVLATKDAHHP